MSSTSHVSPHSGDTTKHPFLVHHFDNIVQQRQCASFGMWVFLVTEIMFFGGIFAGYTVYKFLYPEMFHEISQELDVHLGTLNTVILLTSSLTMALAVNAAQRGLHKRLIWMMNSTLLLAFGFLIVKTFEYYHKFEHGLIPGSLFHFKSKFGDLAQIFMSFYFGATGLHGLHVLIGIGLIAYFTWKASRGHFPKENYQPIEILGLYWHFVDLVWIYLFPLFYLIGRN